MKALLLGILLAASTFAQIVAISACSFSGAGLNDATCAGTFTGAPANHAYVVSITATGTPDHFKWSKDGGSLSSAIAITGSAQTLADGVTITFAATTGHTLAASWSITATASGSSILSFIQRGFGAIFRTHQEKSRENISVLDFGADPTGTADSSVAIINGVAQALTLHSCLRFPYGTYKVNGTVIQSPALGQLCVLGPGNAVPATGVLAGLPPRSATLIQYLASARTASLLGLSNVVDGLDFTIATGVTGVTAIYATDTMTQPFAHNRILNNTIHGYSTGGSLGTQLAAGIDIESIGANSNNNTIRGNVVENATTGYILHGASTSAVTNANDFHNWANNNTHAAVLTNMGETGEFWLSMEGNGDAITGVGVCCSNFNTANGEQVPPHLMLSGGSHDNTLWDGTRCSNSGFQCMTVTSDSQVNNLIDLRGLWQGITAAGVRFWIFGGVGESSNQTPNLAILQATTDASGTRPVFRAGASVNPNAVDDIHLGPLGPDGISPAAYYFASHAAAATMPGSTPGFLFNQYNTTGQGNSAGGCTAIGQGTGNSVTSQECGYVFNSSASSITVHAIGVIDGTGTLIFPAKVTGFGGITLDGTISQPACGVFTSGTFFYTGHVAGVKDTVQVCAADAADSYAWRSIY